MRSTPSSPCGEIAQDRPGEPDRHHDRRDRPDDAGRLGFPGPGQRQPGHEPGTVIGSMARSRRPSARSTAFIGPSVAASIDARAVPAARSVSGRRATCDRRMRQRSRWTYSIVQCVDR